MKILMKAAATIMLALAAFLVYAVLHAGASAGGARAGVAIGYIAGALVLTFVATKLWRRSARHGSDRPASEPAG
jgi:threonine/homoserine/homoserine lactone efflux protein